MERFKSDLRSALLNWVAEMSAISRRFSGFLSSPEPVGDCPPSKIRVDLSHRTPPGPENDAFRPSLGFCTARAVAQEFNDRFVVGFDESGMAGAG